MSWFHRLERRLEPYAIPNLPLFIVIGQSFLLLTSLLALIDLDQCVLYPALVLRGEWWRLLTFSLIPPFSPGAFGPIFAAFSVYLTYLYGNALERTWGSFRFNLFIFIGLFLTISASFLAPLAPADNLFLASSLFLAFAYLHPDFELYVFFVLPVKIKWIAAVVWALHAYAFLGSDLAGRLSLLAAFTNFFLFFGPDLYRRLTRRTALASRTLQEKVSSVPSPTSPHRHRCVTCGKTDVSHPAEEFRYCSKCSGDQCYCSEHLRTHVHISETPPS